MLVSDNPLFGTFLLFYQPFPFDGKPSPPPLLFGKNPKTHPTHFKKGEVIPIIFSIKYIQQFNILNFPIIDLLNLGTICFLIFENTEKCEENTIEEKHKGFMHIS